MSTGVAGVVSAERVLYHYMIPTSSVGTGTDTLNPITITSIPSSSPSATSSSTDGIHSRIVKDITLAVVGIVSGFGTLLVMYLRKRHQTTLSDDGVS
ncbi:hypothetical protein C8J55DRAFT_608958 [Lentinula edodes]|uniref:Uncharacterized protein n=1 Tax=Lentinula lateritia TaxID=40482 RepID=A0A9W8ZX73_9AGAR|nr:hypothetical protein C8J55DRAFT_608958 [Lentinula edodes]